MASRFTRDKVQTAYLPNYQSTLIYWDFFFFFLLKNVELYDVSEFCLSREFGIYEKTILSSLAYFLLSSFFFFIITINNYSEEALSLGSIGPGGQIGPFPIDKMGLQAQ